MIRNVPVYYHSYRRVISDERLLRSELVSKLLWNWSVCRTCRNTEDSNPTEGPTDSNGPEGVLPRRFPIGRLVVNRRRPG